MGAYCTARVLSALPTNDLTVKAAARAIGARTTTLASRHWRRGEKLKASLDSEWLARVSARLLAGEPIAIVGHASASSPQAFARKFRRLTGEAPRAWLLRQRRGD